MKSLFSHHWLTKTGSGCIHQPNLQVAGVRQQGIMSIDGARSPEAAACSQQEQARVSVLASLAKPMHHM